MGRVLAGSARPRSRWRDVAGWEWCLWQTLLDIARRANRAVEKSQPPPCLGMLLHCLAGASSPTPSLLLFLETPVPQGTGAEHHYFLPTAFSQLSPCVPQLWFPQTKHLPGSQPFQLEGFVFHSLWAGGCSHHPNDAVTGWAPKVPHPRLQGRRTPEVVVPQGFSS